MNMFKYGSWGGVHYDMRVEICDREGDENFTSRCLETP